MNIVAFLVCTGFVTFASLRPMESAQLGNWDKAGHIVLYFVLAVLGYRVVSNPRKYLYLCFVIVIYSGLMEVAQSFTPGRVMSVYDLLANAVGVAIAIFFTKMRSNPNNI